MGHFRALAGCALLVALVLEPIGGALAQEGQSLANQTANPLGGDFMTYINQYDRIKMQGRLIDGPGPPGSVPGPNPLAPSSPHINVYTQQPVISAPLKNVIGPGWSFVMRPTFQYFFDTDLPNFTNIGLGDEVIFPPGGPPIIPDGGLPFSSENGWGDPSTFAMVGKTINLGGGTALIVAGGLATSAPWGDSRFTNDKYTLGPAGAVMLLSKPGVIGFIAQQFWDVADDRSGGSAPDVNKMLLQVPYFINLTDKWQLGAAPLWTLDWENDSYEIPLALGLTYTGPVLKGLPPMKLGFEVSTYADQDEFYGGDWGIKVAVIPILPSPIKALFPGLYK